MNENIQKYQEKVFKTVVNKINDFYLAGGTVLALFYFKHRESLDIDLLKPLKRVDGINVLSLEGYFCRILASNI